MKLAIDPDDRQFLERLHRMGGGTIQAICAELGVTATAIRQRLMRLQDQDLVIRDLVRSGRGRPHHAYRISETGRRELGENYSELATILWRELKRIEEPEVRSRVLSRVEDALVRSYGTGVGHGSLSERVQQLCGSLASHGFDVEVEGRGSLPVLRENNCPYLELASSDPSICEFEQSVFHRILGVKMTLTKCCLDGHHCCEFHPEVEASEVRVVEEQTV